MNLGTPSNGIGGDGQYFRFPPSQEFHALRMIAPPLSEPVSIDQMHMHSRVDFTEEDSIIQGYIVAAREYCENVTSRLCRPQTWRLSLMQWPRTNFIKIPLGPLISVLSVTYVDSSGKLSTMAQGVDYLVDAEPRQARIVLPFAGVWPAVVMQTASPIQINFRAGYPYFLSTVSVAGNTVAWISGDQFDSSLIGQQMQIGGGGVIVASVPTATSLTLTSVQSAQSSTTLEFDGLPEKFRQAIRLMSDDWYNNRGDEAIGRGVTSVEIKNGVDRLLGTEEVMRF